MKLLRCPFIASAYVIHMTAIATQILDQFRKLPPSEQRKLTEAILREV